MNALLKKDFITSKNLLIIMNLLVLCGIGMVAFFEGTIMVASSVYLMASFLIPIVLTRLMSNDEMKKHYNMLINSFPVTRKSVVLSKYMFYMICYIITAIFLFSIMFILFKPSGEDIEYILFIQSMAFAVYALLIGVLNYMFYTKSYDVAIKYSSIVTITIIYIPMMLIPLAERIFPDTVNALKEFVYINFNNRPFVLISSIFLIGIVLYGICMLLSVRGYCKKDLD